MVGVFHFQTLKQNVQGRLVGRVILPHVTGSQHFHNHREVLFLRRCFVKEIIHQGFQQNLRHLIPKGVVTVCAFRRGTLKQIGYKLLHVILVPQIYKRVITMAFRHIDKVKYAYLITALFEKITGVTEQFALGVKADKGAKFAVFACGNCFIKARLGIETGFTRTATAHDYRVKVAAVFLAVQTDTDILG